MIELTKQERNVLIEIAKMRLSQYRKMDKLKKSQPFSTGGVEIEYAGSIALMGIALAALKGGGN